MWGVSLKPENKSNPEHVRFVIEYSAEKEKKYIPDRLKREAVIGTVTEIDDTHSEFVADMLDSNEIIPWIRSFFGRITDIEFPYTDKIREDIFLLKEYKVRDSNKSFGTINKPSVSKNTHLNTPLFNPIYSSYYLVIKNIIAEYIINNKNPLTNEQITQIVSKTAYIEAPGELYDLINNTSEETTIFSCTSCGISTSINHIPDFPLSTIELRFLATIIREPRITMFLNNQTEEALKKELEDVVPLWETDTVKFFDQNKIVIPFENCVYRSCFQTILQAINSGAYLYLNYGIKKYRYIYTNTHRLLSKR